MKTINKMVAVAIAMIAMIAMIAISACSTQDEPEPKYKGNIDVNFLSSLARGERSVIFDLDTLIIYEKNIDLAKGSSNEWQEISDLMIGWSYKSPGALHIISGQSWTPLRLFNITDPSILCLPWDFYCQETGFKQKIMIASTFKFDPNNLVVTIGDTKYEVEKADGDKYNTSTIYETNLYDAGINEVIPILRKIVSCYTIRTKEVDPDEYLYFESENEAKIAMIRMMREYYGDVVNMMDIVDEKYKDNYAEHPLLNLAAVEDDLLNGRDEKYSWYKQYYPESFD